MGFRCLSRAVRTGSNACLLIVIASTAFCLGDDSSDDDAKPVSFKADIRPLLMNKCWQCHGEKVQKGELALHTPAAIQKGSESGAVIIEGNSAASRLFDMVKRGEMPPDQQGTLDDKELDLIQRWIDGGATFDIDQPVPAPDATQHDVIPILLLRCTACHGRQKQEGNLDLRNREAMLKGGRSGSAIVPGKPDDSLLIKRVRAEEMPPHTRLTEVSVKPMEPTELKTIVRWIELGAPIAVEEPDLSGTADDPLVRPEDRNFWAFQVPKTSPVPKLATTGANNASDVPVDSPIDAFIAQKLIEKGLNFTAPANRLTLLRRLSFDLVGLPPSPEETKDFLDDASPDSVERVVDRLLASPHYGERWGRHWLDVAGYADCEGRREQHLPRPEAWRYRDYVIRAFNSDKPYDRFLLEQIAGDDLADYQHAATITREIEDNLVATAFLRLAPDPTWANLTGFVPDRLEVTSDSIDVLGSGVMGLTFKCARCHTHKFDPIPQRDYYRLVAMFKGAYDEHDWLKPELKPFGGAMSVGFGDRLLPYVATAEQQQWQEKRTDIQRQIDELKARPSTAELEKQIKDLETKIPLSPRIMALWDRGEPSPTYIYRRGNYATAGAYVSPGVPAVLTAAGEKISIEPPWPGATSTGRRLALAQWLVNPKHPLTSRVMVNRIWKHHFGQGIVHSLGNFGKTGDRPTHPELLDYLAIEFQRRDWSIKSLHRQMIFSSCYQQQSSVSESAKQLDPSNRLLSRMPLQRLDAEQLRDSMLNIAGELIEAGGGPAEPVQVKPDGLVLTGKRRSIYTQQLRKHPPSLLESFDLPAMNPNCLQRTDSLVPTQALHLWNDTVIRQLARKFADRVIDDTNKKHPSVNSADHQIEEVYWRALDRPPQTEERSSCLEILERLKAAWSSQAQVSPDEADRRALSTVCHTILNSADFLYID